MNPRSLRFTALAVVFAFGFIPDADVVEYTDVNPTASTISLTYNQMGSRVYDTFSKFVRALDFDTKHLEAAQAKLTMTSTAPTPVAKTPTPSCKSLLGSTPPLIRWRPLSRPALKTSATTATRSLATSLSGGLPRR